MSTSWVAEIDHHADIAHAGRERAEALGVHLEDAPERSGVQARLQLGQRGVVALDMAHRQDHARRGGGGDDLLRPRPP